jgi:hypothetical protein
MRTPDRGATARRTLDFVVIGAQKAATTTLWRGLDSHPQIRTPGDKERGLFNSEDRYARGLAAFLADTFGPVPAGAVLGTVTPDYMPASKEDLATIVERMRATVPEVRLIALLRDPIERAISHYRTGLRTGNATLRTFDEHYAWVCETRGVIWPPLVRRGEYGRILARYADAFTREQLLVLWTEQLQRDPAAVYREAFAFLGVDAAHLPPLDERLNAGGTRTRVPPEALEELTAHMDRHVWPLVEGDREELRRATRWWMTHLWNTAPDTESTEIGAPLRRRLAAHYLADAELLRDRLGLDPPWRAAYEAEVA